MWQAGCSIYLHIPFCKAKCPYCHFYVLPNVPSSHAILTQGLQAEWEMQLERLENKHILSIYFGGGTPSLLSPQTIHNILSFIDASAPILPHCEITLEANPENITLQYLSTLRSTGVNRISFGVQSLENTTLLLLGRGHSTTTAITAIHDAASAGFDNISIDLMYDVPSQTTAEWQYTLEHALSLPITHLSLYNLVLEPGTVFYKKKRQIEPLLPPPEESLAMWETAVAMVEAHGLARYEISAFAKQGFHSRHNTGYWTGRPFLGFGPSAYSFWEGTRMRNVCSFSQWIRTLQEHRSPVDFHETLPPDAAFRELLAVHLRLCEGVDLHAFCQRHGPMPHTTSAAVCRMLSQGLLQHNHTHLQLTPQGMLFYDTVASELI